MLVTMLKLFDNSVIISSISKLFVLRTTFKARNKKKADGRKKKKKKAEPQSKLFLFLHIVCLGFDFDLGAAES